MLGYLLQQEKITPSRPYQNEQYKYFGGVAVEVTEMLRAILRERQPR